MEVPYSDINVQSLRFRSLDKSNRQRERTESLTRNGTGVMDVLVLPSFVIIVFDPATKALEVIEWKGRGTLSGYSSRFPMTSQNKCAASFNRRGSR